MTDLVFFYGTLMSGFKRAGPLARRRDAEPRLAADGSRAALFDLGIYPAAIPAADSASTARSIGCRMARTVLAVLDELEGFSVRPSPTRASTRRRDAGDPRGWAVAQAWVYFYNAPLGQAQRIESGDYLEHLRVK